MTLKQVQMAKRGDPRPCCNAMAVVTDCKRTKMDENSKSVLGNMECARAARKGPFRHGIGMNDEPYRTERGVRGGHASRVHESTEREDASLVPFREYLQKLRQEPATEPDGEHVVAGQLI